MQLGIGIDTGGTFTDGVIVELESGTILSKAKTPTTREDLKRGIGNAISGLEHRLFREVKLVSLSTTLATNSTVEGKGARVGLIAAVAHPESFRFPGEIPAERVAVIAGAHDTRGRESAPLDLDAAGRAIAGMAGEVDAIAISGYFSIYNASHELRLKELIAARCNLPVVCGHELTGAVGLVERAVTAVLNARLLPVLRELLDAARQMLDRHGIEAPIMVVQGDGSLVGEELARQRPVETVLSGPAASIAGACRLTGLADAVVVDMGGTTTDIGIVAGGSIATAESGAVVGGWQTRVKAVDMWSVGLGGDSRIEISPDGACSIGPRRAIPLCVAACRAPELVPTLKQLLQQGDRRIRETGPLFLTLVRRPDFILSRHEEKLMTLLEGKVVHRSTVAEQSGPYLDLGRFVELGAVAEVAFTPTDLMHALGALSLWDREAACCGAELLAGKAGMEVPELLELVQREIHWKLALQIAAKALHQEPELAKEWSPSAELFLRRLLQLSGEAGVSAALRLSRPIVAVGAPVRSFLPTAAAALGTRLVIPEHAEVANAFGAVTGSVVEKQEAFIRPARPDGFAVVSAEYQGSFETLQEATAFARERVTESALAGARRRGGRGVVVTLQEQEQAQPLKPGWGDKVLLELKITATAVGRPLLVC
jgi:N-methylhydantoinase A/oxoprolinase/acetone carboxylase beta subunit